MIAFAPPENPAGASTVGGEGGFQEVISAFLSARAGAQGRPMGPNAPTGDAPPPHAGRKAQTEPLVLPGAVETKEPEPQVLPGDVVKEAEPLVLPEAEAGKETGPQVLPGAKPAADVGPVVLPGVPMVKADPPQVLSGPVAGKTAAPQVLPDSHLDAVAPPLRAEPPAPAAAGTPDAAARPAVGAPQAEGPHPAPPPPLRALAERTSKPIEDTSRATGSSPAPTETKVAAPVASPSGTAEQPGKPAPPSPPADAAPQADAAAPTLDEARPSGGPSNAASEGADSVRGPGLPTLSHAAVEATAQIAAQILRKLEGRSTRFEIALRPDELGRVDVKLDIDSEGRLAARLAFDNPVAAADLRGRVDELRRQLEAAGFQLAEDALEFAERDSGSSAFDRGHDAQQKQGRAFAAAARLNAETDAAPPTQRLALSLSPSGVDMKV